MNSPLAYSYIRMSTNLQLKGDSLRRQIELSQTYADQHGLLLVSDEKLHDIGVSAFKGDNVSSGALGRFLASVKAGNIAAGSYLLVESLDRLSRQDLLPSVQLLLDIIGQSIHVVTLLDGKTYSKENSDMASMMMSIALMSRAHEESQTKSRRVGEAWKAKRSRIGDQKLTKICPGWLTLSPDRRSFKVIDEHRKTVEYIFELSDQGMGSYSVTKSLNEQKIPPFGRSALWNQSYVTKILQNRAVLGEYQPHILLDGKRKPEGEPIADYFPRIIADGLFYRVQQARRSRGVGSGGPRGESQRNLFTHIAKCGYCGSPMHLVNKGTGPKGGIYLRCHRAMVGGECTRVSWKYDEFEQSFLFFVREIDLDSVVNAAAQFEAKQEYDNAKKGLTAKREHEELRRERLLDLLGDERQDLAILKERLASTEQEIQRTNLEIASLEDPTDALQSNTPSSNELLDLIAGVRGDGALDKRIKLASHLKSIISKISLETEGNTPLRSQQAKRAEVFSDKDFNTRFLNHTKAMDEMFESGEPQFTVYFADGRSRVVRVKRGDPTSFIQMLIGEKNDFGELGKPREWTGTEQAGWFLSKNIQEKIGGDT